jgi:ribosomal protein S18 acetylase RimI-like enzyme
MSNTLIRKATSSDFADIQALYKQIDEQHHNALPNLFKSSNDVERPLSYFENILDNENSLFLVAVIKEKIIGFIQNEISETDHPLIKSYRYGHISDLVIDSELKRKGIGKLLLKESHKWFQEKEITEVNLTVFDFNEEAIEFYRNLGYVNKHHTMTTLLNNNEIT